MTLRRAQILLPGAECVVKRLSQLIHRVFLSGASPEQQNSLPGRQGVRRLNQWKLSPQAHEPVALGLSMVKPCFSIVSAKSIVAPPR